MNQTGKNLYDLDVDGHHIGHPPRRPLPLHAGEMPRLRWVVNLSPEHFHRLFSEQFHTTPFEYLLRRRLARACQLLVEGTLSVKQVATACGYDDPYYFSRLFHKRHGYTPRDVRLGRAASLPCGRCVVGGANAHPRNSPQRSVWRLDGFEVKLGLPLCGRIQ
jgi:AraC-like DNA-binding protein